MKHLIHIKGMHCASCEVILEKELTKINGISKCEASHKKGTIEIECQGEIPYKKIKEAVQKSGYDISEKGANKNDKNLSKEDYWQLIFVFLFIAIIAFLLQKFEISRFFPEISDNTGILVSLLLGVVASLSTCLVLVGGIVLSFGSIYPVHEDSKHPILSKAKPHIYFHIGRIGGFIILGGILGLIGSKINYSLTFTGYLTIFVALIMLYMGFQIIGIFPSITKLGFHLPKSFSGKIHSLQEKNHPLTPIIIGILTFLLPCGFTQSMQVAAIASGSFFTGAMIMGAFAIGTFPALFSLGLGSSYIKTAKLGFLNKVIGVIVIFFALYSFNSGLILSGANLNIDLSTEQSENQAPIENGFQIVKMDVDWIFTPNKFVIRKDIPVRWEINGINISGCSSEVVIPRLGISKKIDKGLNIVEFTPKETGVLPFSCWMGMIDGKFIVVD